MTDNTQRRPMTPFDLGEVRVDPARLCIVGPSGPLHLEPRVMDVLLTLAERAPEPVTRDELIDAVWRDAVVTDGVLSRCISILRERLGDDRASPRFIETLSKRGYRLLAPVAPAQVRPTILQPVGPHGPATGVSCTQPGYASAVSIAVLPFVNLAADATDEHVADGLTELLIAHLAGVASLRVIARTSSMAYKAVRKRVCDIAAELAVDYVVEGSVRCEGSRIQVVARLIEAHHEANTWTHTSTLELRDLLTLLGGIAKSIADAVSVRLLPAETARLARRVSIGESALQHYLKGRFFWAQRGPGGLHKSAEAFAACVLQAPDFAPAHCGLADCQIVLALYGIAPPLRAAAAAREHHARALALDPEGPEVLTALGAMRLFFDWDFAGAEQAFVRALAANPSYTTAHLAYGDLLMTRGDFDRGLAHIRSAVRLSPFDIGLAMNLGDFLIFSGRLDEAVHQFEETLEMDEHFAPARVRLAEALALAGHGAAACVHAARALAEAPGQPRVRETSALVHAATGHADEARRELADLAAGRKERHVCAWEIARGYAALVDADAAIAWIDIAIRERAPMTVFTGVHPGLDPIRHDPRFALAIERIGLRPEWSRPPAIGGTRAGRHERPSRERPART